MGRHESCYERSSQYYRRPRSAYRAVNIAPEYRRVTNAFGGCEWSGPPARTDLAQAPPRRPSYQSSWRSDNDDGDGLVALALIPIMTIALGVGAYKGLDLAEAVKPHLDRNLAQFAEPVGITGGVVAGIVISVVAAIALDYAASPEKYRST